MSKSAWNDRLSEDRSVGKNVDSRASPVASQLSPSLLDSSEQNVNTGKSTSHVPRVRSHSNDSRASAKNNQSKYHQPELSKSQTEQQRIFKSPARVARSRNKSNNINSANKTLQNKNETAGRSMPTSEPNRLSLSQSVERITGVCSYVQKHVIDALEGFSQFLANEVSKVRNIVFVIVFIFGFINCNVVLLDANTANFG